MKWTVIVVGKEGVFSYSFAFVGSHDKREAFVEAQRRMYRGHTVGAIVAGDHPVYHPSMDA